jgi:hypothetical protein
MKTVEVLRTSRAMIRAGRSASSASFGDWPDAVAAFDCGNPRWRPIWWLPALFVTRRAVIRALDRAITCAEEPRQ